MNVPALMMAAAMSVCLCGCGAAPDSDSGGDARRSEAREIQPNAWVDDRVSAAQGDNTDWKSFELPVSSGVTLVFWWDDPAVHTRVVLRDQHGRALHEAEHDGASREDRFGPVDLPEGLFFLQIEALSGASVYTMQVATGQGGRSGRPSF